jgi:hypothetical protein
VQFTPDGDGYTFEAPTVIGSLIGRACRSRGMASPAGVDTLWTFERRRIVRAA